VLDFVSKVRDVRPRSRPRFGIAYDAIAHLFAIADVIIVMVASIVGCSAYQQFISGSVGDIESYLGQGVVASLAYGLSARHLGLYELKSLLQARRDYWRIIACVLAFLFLLTVVLFLFKLGTQFSRGSIVSFTALAIVLLITWRKVAKRHLRAALLNGDVHGRRTLLIGTSDELAAVNSEMLLLGFGVDEAGRAVIPYQNSTRPVSALAIAAIASAVDKAREILADDILLCIPWDNPIQLQSLREQLRVLPLPIRLLPDRQVRSIWEFQASSDISPRLIEVQRAPLSRSEQAMKRAFDVAVALFSLIALSPLLVLTAIALRFESPKPVIFRQRRKGFDGQEFQIYKFRSMSVLEDGPKIAQARRDDVRVTKLGRILRRTSIDELPQLFNVLRGEMSIIGPRPHARAHDDEYGALIGEYAFRRHVKPGMTGWAQVNGLRGGTPRIELMQRRIDLDLWYINNWSIGLDFQILGRTCLELMRARRAY
jgi:undecaprenyl-phosphate galactose phosphotransferase/putative colanic acid biosynthesis UDP-glucose lipid carrier transferase